MVREFINRVMGRGDDEDDEDGPDLSEDSDGDSTSSTTNPANYLSCEQPIWYKDKVVLDGTFARTYSLDGWPPLMKDNMMLALIMNANVSYDTSIHADPYDDLDAEEHLSDLEAKLNDKRTGDFSRWVPNLGAVKETEDVLGAMQQHLGRGVTLFDVGFYITIYADSEDDLEDAHNSIMDNLDRTAGVSTNKCALRQKQAMVSNSPIGKNTLGDKNKALTQLMLGQGLAKTFPFVEDTFMEPGGVLFGVNENSYTPVIIDIFNRKNGYNMYTSGMIGAGKSFSSSQILMSMDAAYSDFRQFIIDPMGGFSGVNNALDGDRLVINGGESINPLDIEPTPEHVLERAQGKVDPWTMKKQELQWFFSQFFEMRGSGGTLSHEELGALDQAITMTYSRFGINENVETHTKDSPTIMDLRETLIMMAEDVNDYADTGLEEEVDMRRNLALGLIVALDPFKPGGEYHNLAQPTDIRLSDNRTIYLDLQQIPEQSDDLGIMMQLLFMKLYQKAKTTTDKVALTIDESHKIMGDATLSSGLEEMFRHSRHFDLSINLISQTPEEFYATATARAIAKQCTIKRFHRVDSLDDEVVEKYLKMNANEVSYIENAEMGDGKKDYSQALLQISDDDRSIPLQIRATRTEQMIIDYDPDEDVSDFDTPSEQSLKQALDTYNSTSAPIYVGPEDELNNRVRAEIAFKERNRKRVLAQEDPSLLDEPDRKDLTVQSPEKSSKGQDGDGSDVTQSHDGLRQEAERQGMSVAKFALKNQFGDKSGIDNLDEDEVDLIAMQYDVGEPDESIEEKRKLLKIEFFGSGSGSGTGSSESKPEAAPSGDGDATELAD